MSAPLCKDCKHFRPDQFVCHEFGGFVIPALCKRTDFIAGTHGLSCADERLASAPEACGRSGQHWEVA